MEILPIFKFFYVVIFSEKFLFRPMDPFGPKNGASSELWIQMGLFGPINVAGHNSGSTLRTFFQIFPNQKGQDVHQNYIIGFRKNYSGQLGYFESKNDVP